MAFLLLSRIAPCACIMSSPMMNGVFRFLKTARGHVIFPSPAISMIVRYMPMNCSAWPFAVVVSGNTPLSMRARTDLCGIESYVCLLMQEIEAPVSASALNHLFRALMSNAGLGTAGLRRCWKVSWTR